MKKYFLILCGIYALIWLFLFVCVSFSSNEIGFLEIFIMSVGLPAVLFYPPLAFSLLYKLQLNERRWLFGCAAAILSASCLFVWIILDANSGKIAQEYRILIYFGVGLSVAAPLSTLVIGIASTSIQQLNVVRFIGCFVLAGTIISVGTVILSAFDMVTIKVYAPPFIYISGATLLMAAIAHLMSVFWKNN